MVYIGLTKIIKFHLVAKIFFFNILIMCSIRKSSLYKDIITKKIANF